MKSLAFGFFLALICIVPLHAQTATNAIVDADAAAAKSVPADQAPGDQVQSILDLVHTRNYAQAQRLTVTLLLAYPGDPRLIQAKVLLDKLLAAQPGSAGLVQQAGSSTPPDQLTGMDRVDYDALIQRARDAQQTTDLSQQKVLLKQFMDKSSQFLQKHQDQMLIWQIRAKVALILDDPEAGYEAGQKLLAAGTADSNDPNLRQLLAQLKIKGWLDKQGVEDYKKSVFPEMVTIPPGSFTMGSPSTEQGRYDSEGPQHQVAINYSFEVGKYDVTRDQYAEFVSDTNRPDNASCYVNDGKSWNDTPGAGWRDPGFTQTGRDPAVCVSWDDAQAYVQWLSAKTGKQYRLLSESEWEYAARAGTTTAYYWGDTASHDYANYGSDTCCSGLVSGRDQWVNTSPVGSFPANAFGLYDMLGNVWQWTADCRNETYAGAPMDGSAWQTGTCGQRVYRGGSWHLNSRFVRAANRYRYYTGDRYGDHGFRVARTL